MVLAVGAEREVLEVTPAVEVALGTVAQLEADGGAARAAEHAQLVAAIAKAEPIGALVSPFESAERDDLAFAERRVRAAVVDEVHRNGLPHDCPALPR